MKSIVSVTSKNSVENTNFYGNMKYENVCSAIVEMERCDVLIPNVGLKIKVVERLAESETDVEIFINKFGFAGGNVYDDKMFVVCAKSSDNKVFEVNVEFDETLSTPIYMKISEWFDYGDFEDDRPCDVSYSEFHTEIVTD